MHLSGVRIELLAESECQWFDYIAFNDVGECLLHLFFANRETMLSLQKRIQGIVGPSELSDLEGRTFIEQRIEKLPRTGRTPWWAKEFS